MLNVINILGKHYGQDFGIEFRIGRFHNIYGPYGTWKGGREKAPAAFLRKAICCDKEFEMWGDGKQTRSFCYIDDCVEGILRLFRSDVRVPINSTFLFEASCVVVLPNCFAGYSW